MAGTLYVSKYCSMCCSILKNYKLPRNMRIIYTDNEPGTITPTLKIKDSTGNKISLSGKDALLYISRYNNFIGPYVIRKGKYEEL